MVGSISPLGHEVHEGCTLDDPGGAELEIECLKLDVPFSNSLGGIRAPEHPLQWVRRKTLMGWPSK